MANNPSDVNLIESMEEVHSFLDMELEALQSIFINELEVKEDEFNTAVSIDLHPATADKLDEQYVRMTLQLIVSQEYPEKVPEIKIRNSRGLSDEKINCIIKDLSAIAESKRGNSMLFEMIDAAKEHLTTGNRPSGECAICLYGFSENDVFTKTECYHYFHSHCLARYTMNFNENLKELEDDAKIKPESNELLCPMCRIPIQFDATDDCDYPSPEESDESSFVLTEEIVELQKRMADLYLKQVEKGGIIDIEAEKNKYLLEISNVPSRTNNDESSMLKNASGDESVSESKEVPSEEVENPNSDSKELVKKYHQRFDHRGKNRNYGRPNEGRGNYRYNQRYSRPPYNNSRGSFNRNKYGKNNQSNYQRQDRVSDPPAEPVETTITSWDVEEVEDVSNSQDLQDNVSETSDQVSGDLQSKQSSSSPRYNQGYRRGNNYNNHPRNNYGNYSSNYRNRRPEKSNHESHYSQGPQRYSSNYSRPHNNYSKNRFADRDQYHSERDNFRGRRNFNREDRNRYRNDGEERNRYSNDGDERNRYRNDGDEKNRYRNDGDEGNRYSHDLDERNKYRNDGDDRHRYRNDGDDRNRYRNDGDERNMHRNDGVEKNRYKNDGDEKNRYRNDGDERNRYRNDGDDRNRFKNDAEDRNKFKNDGEDKSRFRNEGEDKNRFRNEEDKNRFRNEGEGRNKFRNDGEDRNRFRNDGEDRNSRFRNDGEDRNRFKNDGENRNRFRNDGEDRNRFRNDGEDRNRFRNDGENRNRFRNDKSYNDGYNKQGSRNYSTNRRGKYSDKSYSESSNNEHSELVKSTPEHSNSKSSDILPIKSEPCTKKNVISAEDKTSQNKELTGYNARCSEKPAEVKALPDKIGLSAFPNASNENSQIRPRSVHPPPGFANPLKKVIYGLQGANPPPGFNKS